MSDFDKMEPMINKAIKSDGTEYEPYAKGTTLQSSSERNIEKYKRSSPFANKMINADGSVTEIDFSSGGGGGGDITLPISSDDVTYNNNTQTTFNGNMTNYVGQMSEVLNQIGNPNGDGATLIYVAVPGYPVMTLEQALTLVSEVLPNKLNIVDFNLENANDVDHINADEVIYKDKVTGKFTSFPMLVPDSSEAGTRGGALLEHKLDESFSMTRDTPRIIPFAHYGTQGGGINDAFSNGTFSIQVDDDIHTRKINYKVYLKNYSKFTYRIELLNNDEVIDTQELITSNTGDVVFGSWGFNYVSPTGQDEFKLQITEIDGTYPNAEIVIVSGTELAVDTMNLGNYKIDPKYLPQEEYVPFETLPNLTLNATKQTLLSVSPFDKGIMQIKPGDLTSNLILNRSGGGTSVGYVNASIYLNGVVANTVSASFDSNRDGILLPLSNALKVVDYDTSQTLEVRVSYTSTPNGATIGAGTVEIAGGVASLTATPK